MLDTLQLEDQHAASLKGENNTTKRVLEGILKLRLQLFVNLMLRLFAGSFCGSLGHLLLTRPCSCVHIVTGEVHKIVLSAKHSL